MEIPGRTALVTGGARRVGRSLALALAEAGADVVVNYNASADDARATVAEIEACGRRSIAVRADVSRASDVAHLIAATEQAFGRLDILVNSAALFHRTPFLQISEAEWDHVLAVNLKGPFLLSQAAAPLLAKDGGGTIVNIVDLSALQPWPSFGHHAVSKAGLLHLTRVMARALAPAIRVNAIAPGTVLPPEGQGEEGSERRVIERDGTPTDVVEALLYLVRADFVTGENLLVEGGRMLL
jgi:NAD(P)-dependent dehydrogenase (short-subunit alcohol dehydrogenase family)